MIIKKKGKFVVVSEKSGRKFGTYKTMREAKARLRQIELFKYLKPIRNGKNGLQNKK